MGNSERSAGALPVLIPLAADSVDATVGLWNVRIISYLHLMEIARLDLTLGSLEENLALDEALLLEADEHGGSEVLRFWEWPRPVVVLGAGGILQAEVFADQCAADGVAVQRRASGGGTVLLGSGCLLYSLVLRFDRDPALKDVNASYRYILGRVKRALSPLGPIELSGISDLSTHGRKFSGNAQQRKRNGVLHHGTLLYRFDLTQIGRFLKQPERQPAYRESRDHERFVTNFDSDDSILKTQLAREWGAAATPIRLPLEKTRELVAQKYSLSEWTARR